MYLDAYKRSVNADSYLRYVLATAFRARLIAMLVSKFDGISGDANSSACVALSLSLIRAQEVNYSATVNGTSCHATKF